MNNKIKKKRTSCKNNEGARKEEQFISPEK